MLLRRAAVFPILVAVACKPSSVATDLAETGAAASPSSSQPGRFVAETLPTSLGTPAVVAHSEPGFTDIAPAGDSIWAIEKTSPQQLVSIALADGKRTVVAHDLTDGDLLFGSPSVVVYTTLCGEGLEDPCLMRAALDKTAPSRLAVLHNASVVADADAAYFVEATPTQRTLVRLPLAAGATPTKLASRAVDPKLRGSNVGRVALDAASVYWSPDFTILRVPKGGGDAAEVARGNAGASDGKYVYWTEARPSRAVKRVPVTGGPVETIARGRLYNPSGIALDDAYVYWVSTGEEGRAAGGLHRIPRAGGPDEPLALRDVQDETVFAGGGYLYWVDLKTHDIERVPTTR